MDKRRCGALVTFILAPNVVLSISCCSLGEQVSQRTCKIRLANNSLRKQDDPHGFE
jgi:hypothetical protein